MYRGFVIKKSTIDSLPALYTRALAGDDYKEVVASIKLDNANNVPASRER